MRATPTSYVHWRGNFVSRRTNPVLPVVTSDTIYLRGKYLSAEKRDQFRIGPNGRLRRTDSRWAPKIVRWRAWAGVPMTAICKTADTVFTGAADGVFATAADDGRQLWSAPVPGRVTDLAFNGGRLFVACEGGRLLCFGPRR